jgi:hypothetical protein
MTPDLLDLLSRHYGYAKGRLARLGGLVPEERGRCEAGGFPLDRRTLYRHDDAVTRLRTRAADLDPAAVARAFLAGLTPAFPRGRQPLISYAFARHLPEHAFRPASEGKAPGETLCLVCGINLEEPLDATEAVLRTWLGWSWNERPIRYLPDLEAFDPREVPPAAVAQGREVLEALLEAALDLAPEATPSLLEKEIARRKLLPGTDKYQRLGVLEALAEAGVLPNERLAPSWDRFVPVPVRWEASRAMKGAPRSDIVLPFGAWRGRDGVDREAVQRVFGPA